MVVEKEVETNSKGQKSYKISVEEIRGYTLDQFIDKNPLFKIMKKQILTKPNNELPYYIKPPYLILKRKQKKEMQVGQFKKLMEMLNKIWVNIPFCEALE